MGPVLAVPLMEVAAEVAVGALVGVAVGGAVVGVGVLTAALVQEFVKSTNQALQQACVCHGPTHDHRPWNPTHFSEPDPEPTASGSARTRRTESGSFRLCIMEAKDLVPKTLMSVNLKGETLSNSMVPFYFSMFVGIARVEGKALPPLHCALLFRGDFAIGGTKYEYVVADRWKDSVTVRGMQNKTKVLQEMKSLSWAPGVPFEHIFESKEFSSVMPAPDMVDFVHEDLRLEPKILKEELNLDALLASPDTNCVLFALRGGLRLLHGEEERKLWIESCTQLFTKATGRR